MGENKLIYYNHQYTLSQNEKEELKTAIEKIPKKEREEAVILETLLKDSTSLVQIMWGNFFTDEYLSIMGRTADVIATILNNTVNYDMPLKEFCKTYAQELYSELF